MLIVGLFELSLYIYTDGRTICRGETKGLKKNFQVCLMDIGIYFMCNKKLPLFRHGGI